MLAATLPPPLMDMSFMITSLPDLRRVLRFSDQFPEEHTSLFATKRRILRAKQRCDTEDHALLKRVIRHARFVKPYWTSNAHAQGKLPGRQPDRARRGPAVSPGQRPIRRRSCAGWAAACRNPAQLRC